MKQTLNTHACSLAGEGAAAYSLARRVAAAVTGKSGEAAAGSLARDSRLSGREGKLRNRC